MHVRGTVVTKAPLKVQFLLALGGRGWERGKAEASSTALLSKKEVGREGSIESQQKSDFFCFESLPYIVKCIGLIKLCLINMRISICDLAPSVVKDCLL